jgi:hypothetical protein
VTSVIKKWGAGRAGDSSHPAVPPVVLLRRGDARGTRTDLYGIRLFVHRRDPQTSTARREPPSPTYAFYKSDYVKNKRTLYKVSGGSTKRNPSTWRCGKEIIDKIIKPEWARWSVRRAARWCAHDAQG